MRETSSQHGMTLIEVMIALAIISIAMTAIIKAATQSIRATTHLQNKTIAMWVAENVINEARVGLIKIHESSQQEEVTLLNETWYWQAKEEATPNKAIKKLHVEVFATENNPNDPDVILESYRYAAQE